MVIELQIKEKQEKKKQKTKSEFYYYVSHCLFLSHFKGKSSQECIGLRQSANLYLLCGNAD